MRWLMILFAVVGVAVIGVAAAIATGLVNVKAVDPFAGLNKAAAGPTTGVSDEDVAPPAADSTASLAAQKLPGFADKSIFLSAAAAKPAGNVKVTPRNGNTSLYVTRRGAPVDPKSRLPNHILDGWTGPADTATWAFASPAAGTYVVTFDCVSGVYRTSSSDAKFLLTINGQPPVEAKMKIDQVGRSSFQLIDVATIDLPAGNVSLSIAAAQKGLASMSLRSVRLYPKGE